MHNLSFIIPLFNNDFNSKQNIFVMENSVLPKQILKISLQMCEFCEGDFDINTDTIIKYISLEKCLYCLNTSDSDSFKKKLLEFLNNFPKVELEFLKESIALDIFNKQAQVVLSFLRKNKDEINKVLSSFEYKKSLLINIKQSNQIKKVII